MDGAGVELDALPTLQGLAGTDEVTLEMSLLRRLAGCGEFWREASGATSSVLESHLERFLDGEAVASEDMDDGGSEDAEIGRAHV